MANRVHPTKDGLERLLLAYERQAERYRAHVAALTEERDTLLVRSRNLRDAAETASDERAAALDVRTKEGLLASEWLLRTGIAEKRAEAAEARVKALEEALRTLLRRTDPRVATEVYDEIADAFSRQTGLWPPGRSRPPEMGPTDDRGETRTRWRRFCNEWHERVCDAARAVLGEP